jgi:2-haloacid dehalogenase
MGIKHGSAIEHVVFGLYGVLVDWDPRLALEGFYPDGVVDMFFDPTDEWGFHRYDELLQVGWSETKILADYESTHGPAVAWVFRMYFERFSKTIKGIVPGMDELVTELASSDELHLWGLTNSTQRNVNTVLELIPQIRQLNGIVISGQECLRKPDDLIFQVMLRRFDIKPDRTIFIDTCQESVEAAQRSGIRGIIFETAERLRLQLAQLGVRVCSDENTLN